MKKLIIIDTFGFFFRNYYGVPNLKSREGFPTGLLRGFINYIISIYRDHSTDYLLFALDTKGETFRHQISPDYKANRTTPPEDLMKQLPIAIEWIEKMGFKSLSKESYEADDIIASVTKFAKERGIFVKIITHDKDLYQLIDDDRVVIYNPTKKEIINEKECIKKFGVKPSLIRDYLSIVGDSSDNIKGVKGIGAKGAKKLLEEYHSLENIFKNIDKIQNKRVQNQLLNSKESAFLSQKLVTLKDDLIDELNFDEFSIPKNPLLNIKDSLKKYQIRAVLDRNSIREKPKVEFKTTILTKKEELFKILSKIYKNQIVSFDTETSSLNVMEAKIIGFSFAINEQEGFYVPISHNYLGVEEQIDLKDAKEAIKILFEKAKIVGQNIKYDLAILYYNFGFRDLPIFADTMVISWLLNPEFSNSLESMAKRYFDYEMVKFDDIVKKGENFSNVTIEEAAKYASEDASITFKLYNYLYSKLSDELKRVATFLEFPFIYILLKMELEGILIDIEFFENLKRKSDNLLNQLTTTIYNLTDTTFNINSTKQLGEVLFEKLKLPPTKKTKRGYSTNEQVLETLIDKHPVVAKILEYRELHKLQTTYIEPLINYYRNSKDHRIHTSFFQTGTATGRVSSKNPNLQNIPVKTKIGREIREGFIAKEGYNLISADYSQIELRLLAHFSKDKTLIEAFENDLDIHLETAKKIFKEKEAREKRGVAKSINFGLIYGMGARKLAQTLKIPQKEAKLYIENYFSSFPTVKEYISKVHQEVEEKGYIETLLKRKRYFDFNGASAVQKAGFLREALNSILQGSSADLIKLSMLEISKRENQNFKMLLQIHDELLFEVKEEITKEFIEEIKNIMESIDKIYNIELNVPLKVGISIGKNWGDLK